MVKCLRLREELESPAGVGRKTAGGRECRLGIPAFAVDTHVERIWVKHHDIVKKSATPCWKLKSGS